MATAAIIVQKMIVEQPTKFYRCDGAGGASPFFSEDDDCTDFVIETLNESDVVGLFNQRNITDDIKLPHYRSVFKELYKNILGSSKAAKRQKMINDYQTYDPV
ncbi:hypothetical protein BWQ96_07849 [Gracilariopsis chorda]|uniref:Uncharacterized protein n=1 Tax=Gracilariopsis chorda TaxID=448386 RepID=A0A2V3IK33_9FLOR|nr:hypothetical protein BWQ96_07849 [Gracilariopsis chorda]|eukprot:PXF42408.1 hypothetical protein BWQ96_07849 [Gracilariopsis chorda]